MFAELCVKSEKSEKVKVINDKSIIIIMLQYKAVIHDVMLSQKTTIEYP